MNSRHDRNDAGAQPRTGPVGVPGDALDNGTSAVSGGDTGPFQAVERTPSGWRVADEELPDLTSAMVLADILNAELTADEQAELDAAAASGAPPAPPARQPSRGTRLSGTQASSRARKPPPHRPPHIRASHAAAGPAAAARTGPARAAGPRNWPKRNSSRRLWPSSSAR